MKCHYYDTEFFMPEFFKKIWVYPYVLKYKGRPEYRDGALLKVEFHDGNVGHADFHPWPEKKEAPLKKQLSNLSKGCYSTLLLRSVSIARTESIALAHHRNLLSVLDVPLSHYLILNLETFFHPEKILDWGFKVFKVKMKSPLEKQSKLLLKLMNDLGPGVKWRLDFHYSLSMRQWEEWCLQYLNQIPKERLDFIEAPFPYQEEIWKKYSFFALDMWDGINTLPVSVLVWKSSRKDPKALFSRWPFVRKVIFTHTLAHPLDQLISAYYCADFYKTHPQLKQVGALVQTGIYEESCFSLPFQGSVFPHLSAPGWGLDSFLLKKLSWKEWKVY